MRIYNELPLFINCLKLWKTLPSEEEFNRLYVNPLRPLIEPMLLDFVEIQGASFYQFVSSLNWTLYRQHAIQMDPAFEEARVLRLIHQVENLLGVTLKGEVVLFGAFTLMDGYARFDQGQHRVYLGVDEEHGRGQYLDVLISHELTHVARESEATIWTGFGLDPKMTHDDLVLSMPVIEHLASEGYSCLVSELINPGHPPWAYVYQDQDSYGRIFEYSVSVDSQVHSQLRDPRGHYRNLYGADNVVPIPIYAHYLWAYQWMHHVLKQFGAGDPRKLLGLCSKDWFEDALRFELQP